MDGPKVGKGNLQNVQYGPKNCETSKSRGTKVSNGKTRVKSIDN